MEFNYIQFKPSNDDKICQQIFDKISEEQQTFNDKFVVIEANQ